MQFTKDEVNHRLGGPNHRCGVCPNYRLNRHCIVVDGDIDPDDVCDKFLPPIVGGIIGGEE
jgi:hypothetical protein